MTEEPDQTLRRALAAHGDGDLDAAARLYALTLEARPASGLALHNLGVIRAGEGRAEEALELLERAAEDPEFAAEARLVQGAVLLGRGAADRAALLFESALALRPDHPPALVNLGLARAALGLEAAPLYARAAEIDPTYAPALMNLGAARLRAGALDEAGGLFARAAMADPGSAPARYNIGVVLKAQGRLEPAAALFEEALALSPDYADARINLANVRREQGRLDESVALYETVLDKEPRNAKALVNLGQVLRQRGRVAEARLAFAAALTVQPADPVALLGACMSELPVLYRSDHEIAAARAAYQRRLEAFAAAAAAGEAGAFAAAVGSSQPFYLAYQGRCDRDLQAVYGQTVCAVMERAFGQAALAPPPPPGRRIRLGIVSAWFSAHSNWKIPISGWISGLDRTRFEVLGLHTGSKSDDFTRIAAEICDVFVKGPLSLEGWRRRILELAPDVLIYPEIGMDGLSAQLAAQRLARVQCASWGHPETSGMPSVDYFLSADLMEPAGGESHYTERLVRLPNLGVRCAAPGPPARPLSRRDLGCRDEVCIYWCAQSLYKFLPEFDEVFARIAEGVPECQFVFLEFQDGPEMTALFIDRFDAAFRARGLEGPRHRVMAPRLGKLDFLGAAYACDVFLDSLGWSGCNSTLESLEAALPVVTWPGPLMRGRHSAAILTMMGVEETIASSIDDYVALAQRLGRDPSWRAEISQRMAAGRGRVFGDPAPVRALEDFLEAAVRGPNGAAVGA